MPTTREPTTCSNCRAGLRAGDRFCWTCGTPGTTTTITTATTTTTTMPDRPSVANDLRVERHGSPSSHDVLRVVLPVASVLLVAAGVAGWWLLRPAPLTTTTAVAPPSTSTPTSVTPTPVPPSPEPVVPAVQFPAGVLAGATATAPSTSADSADAGGRTTTYDAENLLDGDTTTAWRMEGDGAGSALTFTFDAPRRITEVGLVNGFAKVDPYDGTDRYDQGRRVLAATWTFDGRTPVAQEFRDDTRALQLIAIEAVEATEITLTITGTSAPGARGRFDRTALSEVQFANR